MAAPQLAVVPSDTEPEKRPATKIEERRTPEMVVGFVGPLGSGVTTAASLFGSILAEDYGYRVIPHNVSDLIDRSAELVGLSPAKNLDPAERIQNLQKIGNELRRTITKDFLARKVIESISIHRLQNGGYQGSDNLVPLPLRDVHVIDSLKHPSEIQLLELIYGDVFWLVGVFAPEDVRKRRLNAKGLKAGILESLIVRDENEDLDHGQKVRDTIYRADFFLRNDGDNTDRPRQALDRFVGVLMNSGVHTPTQHEAAMYHATSAATKSACLSRQVGAAIYSTSGEIIGVGWNDVPRPGGRLYGVEDSDDHRCYLWGERLCHNDLQKEQLYSEVFQELQRSKLLTTAASYDSFRQAIRTTEVRDLIEFSRSIHAEMEAIFSVARAGKAGLEGATLYTTTFPCHSCARHIVASGISCVYYIEPYPKSRALRLHHDAISLDDRDQGRKVTFLQYEGVAPKNIIRLFGHGLSRKVDGKLLVHSKKEVHPVFQPMLDGFTVYEAKIVSELRDVEQRGAKT